MFTVDVKQQYNNNFEASGYTFRESNFASFIVMRSTRKGKNLLPKKQILFLGVDLILEGIHCPKNHI